jgi:hypothetical protein
MALAPETFIVIPANQYRKSVGEIVTMHGNFVNYGKNAAYFCIYDRLNQTLFVTVQKIFKWLQPLNQLREIAICKSGLWIKELVGFGIANPGKNFVDRPIQMAILRSKLRRFASLHSIDILKHHIASLTSPSVQIVGVGPRRTPNAKPVGSQSKPHQFVMPRMLFPIGCPASVLMGPNRLN